MSRLSSSPRSLDQLARVGRLLVERGEQLERLADGDPVGQLALLELDADEAPESLAVPPGIEPEDADRARVGRPETGDRLDGRGLAGAVRAEDAEDLALLDGERHAVDGRRARRSACVRLVTSMTFMGQGSQPTAVGTSDLRPEPNGDSADGRIHRSVDCEAGTGERRPEPPRDLRPSLPPAPAAAGGAGRSGSPRRGPGPPAVPRRSPGPPSWPPPGPRSITQSARATTSRLCSMTITVRPAVDQPVEQADQVVDVLHVEAGRRLVEHVDLGVAPTSRSRA